MKEGLLALSVGVGPELTEFFVAPDSRVAGGGRALQDTAVRAIVRIVANWDGG